jgi:site-specific recombinase XerD
VISTAPMLGTILESFFNDYLRLQRGLRPNSITSYADAMRLFLQFAAATSKKKITHLGLDDLQAEAVSLFLTSLEEKRSNVAQSRNQRLAALCRWRRKRGPVWRVKRGQGPGYPMALRLAIKVGVGL